MEERILRGISQVRMQVPLGIEEDMGFTPFFPASTDIVQQGKKPVPAYIRVCGTVKLAVKKLPVTKKKKRVVSVFILMKLYAACWQRSLHFNLRKTV